MINRIHHFVIAMFLAAFCAPAIAMERILDYHSDITVFKNAVMRVTETIKVQAEGNKIRHGIYRDFPTSYKDKNGNNFKVDFHVEDILRNGKTEPWHIQNESNGVRIYIGSKNKILASGIYTYAITYSTYRQLGYFNDHDELYWNVTGNDWAFVIDKASATVWLPKSVPPDKVTTTAYTGPFGSREQNYKVENKHDGGIYFETTRQLPVKNGLTIVTGWPKGYVHQPDTREKLEYFYRDNRHLVYAAASILLLVVYYLVFWFMVGRDPKKGVVIPLYEPPAGYSPASMRYISRMGYDDTCFAAAILNLAVKGYLSITEDDSTYTLEKTGKTDVKMAPGESRLAAELFKKDAELPVTPVYSGKNKIFLRLNEVAVAAQKKANEKRHDSTTRIELKQDNHVKIRKALAAQDTSLKGDYEKTYFNTNKSYFVGGILLSIIAFILSILLAPTKSSPAMLFLMVWLTLWSFGVIMLFKLAWQAWKQVIHNVLLIIPALFISLFALPFIGAEVFAAYQFAQMASYTMVVLIIIAVAINWLFYELLKAPTRAGRAMLDKIEGFRNYIEVAEKQDLDYRYPGGRTPELFESYLPYALALGVEQKWADHFADVISTADMASGNYSPGWYNGRMNNFSNLGNFTNSFSSSLTSAISASSTAPGSSSGGGGGGGGGGGSSGGGGGGGGGGGW